MAVSQFEKTTTIYYTIRVYGTCSFNLTRIEECFLFHKDVCINFSTLLNRNEFKNVYSFQYLADWKGSSAGGCNKYPTFKHNQKFRVNIFSLDDHHRVVIELKGPKQYQVGFDIDISELADATQTPPFLAMTSVYR